METIRTPIGRKITLLERPRETERETDRQRDRERQREIDRERE